MSLRTLAALLVLAVPLSACGGGGGGGGPAPAALGQPPTETLVVTNHDDAGPGSLRQAVADAAPGAWITFDPALVTAVVNLTSRIQVDKVLTIGGLSGTGERQAIRGGADIGIFYVEGGALQLNDLHLELGEAQSGGAVESYDAPLIFQRVTFDACQSISGGGAIYGQLAPVSIIDCYFVGNASSSGGGGAVHLVECETRIERTAFYDNQCANFGGAINVEGGETTVVNCTLHFNRALAAFADGGAIRIHATPNSGPAQFRMFNATITHNFSGDLAGGISVRGHDGVPAALEMHRSIVSQNDSPDIDLEGAATASGTYNWIGVGGGAYADGLDNNTVGDLVAEADPMLLGLIFLPDGRPVALPLPASPVVNAVPAGTNLNPEGLPMIVDLRFHPRNPAQPSDLGAIELGP